MGIGRRLQVHGCGRCRNLFQERIVTGLVYRLAGNIEADGKGMLWVGLEEAGEAAVGGLGGGNNSSQQKSSKAKNMPEFKNHGMEALAFKVSGRQLIVSHAA